jgi:serine protease Do
MNRSRKFLSLATVIVGLAVAAEVRSVFAQRLVDSNATKSTVALRQAFAEAARVAGKSTVRISVQNPPDPPRLAAYGTVITSDGYILTKGSEILDFKKVLVKLPGKEVEAKIVGNRESYDLAMLKIDAKNLVPVVLVDTSEPPVEPPATQRGMRGFRGFGGGRGLSAPTGPIPAVHAPAAPPPGAIPVTVGEFVVTPEAAGSEGTDLAPKAFGVISVARRSIPFANGVLGVSLTDAPAGGAMVTEVFAQSGAAKAGVAANDVIMAIDGMPVNSRLDLQNQIRQHHPTDTVTLSVTRGDQELSLRVQLGDTILATREDVEMAVLTGNTNTRSSDFQAVFQHDTVLAPSEMGGPLVDLEGRVIGINIARAGRTETYAIPADLLTERWLKSMEDGTFTPRPRN